MAIYKGLNVRDDIEDHIFNETLRLFNEAAAKGLTDSKWSDDVPDEFVNQIRTNNRIWSAFRVHRMQNDIAAQLLDSDGQLKPFDKWLQDIKGMTNHYVGPWLRTEYNTAVLRAHQAADWKHFEAEQDVFPNLRWMPTTSPQQDPLHRQYWESKLTLPINHPFWSEHRPGDRWNCKCTLEQTDAAANDTVIKDFYPVPQQPGLDNNPGEDGKLFSDSHPYITKAYAGAKAAVKRRFQKDSIAEPIKPKRQKSEDEKTIIKTRWNARQARRANMLEVAEKLGVDLPAHQMSFEAANGKRANPLFSPHKEDEWYVNCQCCVVANELRRRGFNVKAKPNFWKGTTKKLADKTEIAWIDPSTGLNPYVKNIGIPTSSSSQAKKDIFRKEFIDELNLETAAKGRYHLFVTWPGERSAHILTAERLDDGALRIYDPQSGDITDINDFVKTISTRRYALLYRVDNMHINTSIIDEIVDVI